MKKEQKIIEKILSDTKSEFRGELCYTGIKVAMEKYGSQCYNQGVEDTIKILKDVLVKQESE